MVRPVLEWIMFRMTTITATRKTKVQNQLVNFGMPIMPRPPFISGKGRMVSELIIRVLMTIVKPERGDPEVVAAQGEHRQAEQKADLGGDGTGKEHRQKEDHLQDSRTLQDAGRGLRAKQGRHRRVARSAQHHGHVPRDNAAEQIEGEGRHHRYASVLTQKPLHPQDHQTDQDDADADDHQAAARRRSSTGR